MDKSGLTDLLTSISHLGDPNVGRMPSMNACVSQITHVNFGGTSVMTEGESLFLMMALLIVGTFLLNACMVQVI